MCLDAGMIIALFVVWIVAPAAIIAGAIFIAVKIIQNRRLK